MLCASILSNVKYFPDQELLSLSKEYLKILEMEVYIYFILPARIEIILQVP